MCFATGKSPQRRKCGNLIHLHTPPFGFLRLPLCSLNSLHILPSCTLKHLLLSVIQLHYTSFISLLYQSVIHFHFHFLPLKSVTTFFPFNHHHFSSIILTLLHPLTFMYLHPPSKILCSFIILSSCKMHHPFLTIYLYNFYSFSHPFSLPSSVFLHNLHTLSNTCLYLDTPLVIYTIIYFRILFHVSSLVYLHLPA